MALLILLGVVAGVVAWAEQTNNAGGVLRAVTTETDSAAPSLVNAAQCTATLAGAGQASPDLQNATGARLYVGHLDPLPIDTPKPRPGAALWIVY